MLLSMLNSHAPRHVEKPSWEGAGATVVSRLLRLQRIGTRDLPRARESAIIVPVPLAEPVSRFRKRHDPSAANGMPAHITLLYPFVSPDGLDEEVRRALSETIARCRAFRFQLVAMGTFPGVLYLVPEPADPLIELARVLMAQWPGHPPYGGRFPDLVPHLTLAQGARASWSAKRIERALPIAATATFVDLMVEDGLGQWRLHRRYPLVR
jgi:2'-5' RNA ligase